MLLFLCGAIENCIGDVHQPLYRGVGRHARTMFMGRGISTECSMAMTSIQLKRRNIIAMRHLSAIQFDRRLNVAFGRSP
jgi:hypothetical protein